MELRDYQKDAMARVRAEMATGARRIALVAPTGAGKTVLAAHLIQGAAAARAKVLFLAHRKELIDQAAAKLRALGLRHGVIMAGHLETDAAIQVASVQTLVRRQVPDAEFVIVDECHHATASSYSTILGEVPRATVLGLTATPWRTDGSSLADLFESSVLVATPAELVARRFLVPVVGFTYDRPDLSGVKVVAGDYDDAAAGEVMRARVLLDRVVERWREQAGGLPTVVFACTIAHSKELVQSFRAAGVVAEHLDGTTPKPEREAILARLRSGETQVVGNVGVLTEGWDEPRVGCVVLARPTKSVGLYLQMVGRGRRPAPGKEVLRLHDHTGCVLEHGEADDERSWGLAKARAQGRKKSASAGLVTCGACCATHAVSWGSCPVCDAKGVSREIAIRYVAGAERALNGKPPPFKAPDCPESGLTDEFLEALPAVGSPYEVFDRACPGLCLRVTPSGGKTFRWYTKAFGLSAITIGRWAALPAPGRIGLRDARERLVRLKEARKGGLASLRAESARQRRPAEEKRVTPRRPPVRLPVAAKMGGAANRRGGKQVWVRLAVEHFDFIDPEARRRAASRGVRQIDRGEIVREALDAWIAHVRKQKGVG